MEEVEELCVRIASGEVDKSKLATAKVRNLVNCCLWLVLMPVVAR